MGTLTRVTRSCANKLSKSLKRASTCQCLTLVVQDRDVSFLYIFSPIYQLYCFKCINYLYCFQCWKRRSQWGSSMQPSSFRFAIVFGNIHLILVLKDYFRRFKKKKETRLAEARQEQEEELTVGILNEPLFVSEPF